MLNEHVTRNKPGKVIDIHESCVRCNGRWNKLDPTFTIF